MSDDDRRNERASLLLEIDDAEQAEAAIAGRIQKAQLAYNAFANGLHNNRNLSFTRLEDGRYVAVGTVHELPDAEQVAADVEELDAVRATLAELAERKRQP